MRAAKKPKPRRAAVERCMLSRALPRMATPAAWNPVRALGRDNGWELLLTLNEQESLVAWVSTGPSMSGGRSRPALFGCVLFVTFGTTLIRVHRYVQSRVPGLQGPVSSRRAAHPRKRAEDALPKMRHVVQGRSAL